ncbi:calcium activated cation channel [Calocera viscosa TUFC12733]|uniref:Calcium activated cation channel n=1 Tax=Calocera viscosa (strain TUFC12733) TaxID=1330018 RepID=A0A167QR40_CALVF|nr:calcium activated cation channel [Calocera viscosa TUFC12733]
MADGNDEERGALIEFRASNPSAVTVSRIVKRLRAMVLTLLPIEVEESRLIDSTTRIITPAVINSFGKAAGDFQEALPFCLLRARRTFEEEAQRNPADFDENMARAMACEILARKLVHVVSPERLNHVMSKRFRYKMWDGSDSSAVSALETAIDQHCTIFLSSTESQHVVQSLWNGDWIQKNNDDFDIEYVPYTPPHDRSVWQALNPDRLSVPSYQNWLRVFFWLCFLFIYSSAVQQPLDRLDPKHYFDIWEVMLYVQALAYSLEELTRTYQNVRYYTWKAAFSFWVCISLFTDALLIAAFAYRIAGMASPSEQISLLYHLRSFQILSCVSPLIWMKLLTIVDGFKYIGTMQICVSRMLKESGIFFALLAIIAVGFIQAMFALDVADGANDQTGWDIINLLLQALLSSPDFTMSVAGASSFGLFLFYCWNVITSIILLNILISLFSSAYADVTDHAEAEFLTFFAHKTVDMIRAPDNFVYPAPFNLIETFLIIPWQPFLSRGVFRKINRVVMTAIFFIPLCIVSIHESHLNTRKSSLMRSIFNRIEEPEDDIDELHDPPSDDPQGEISTIPFEDLVAGFPNIAQSSEESILTQIAHLRDKLDYLVMRLDLDSKDKDKNGDGET